MVNFQLGKLNVKDEIINNDTSVGTKKKSGSPTGIEPMTSRTPGGVREYSYSGVFLLNLYSIGNSSLQDFVKSEIYVSLFASSRT